MDRILAIAGLRFKNAARSLHGGPAVLEALGRVLMLGFGLFVACGLTAGMAILIHYSLRDVPQGTLRASAQIIFYTCSFFGLVLPVLRGAMDRGFDARPLLVYPIERRRLYAINLAACFGSSEHCLYYPALLGVFVAGALLPGVHPVGLAALLALQIVFYVVWANTLGLALVGVMRRRRLRELVAIAAFLVIMALAITPTVFNGTLVEPGPATAGTLLPLLRRLGPLVRTLPPEIAADGFAAFHGERLHVAFRALLQLLLWDLAGIGAGWFVFSRFHLGESSESPPDARSRRVRRAAMLSDARVFAWIPAEIRAVASKDLRYLFRSVVGRLNLLVLPLLLVVFGAVIAPSIALPVPDLHPDELLLYAALVYTVLFSNNFLNNALAWEGDGIAFYFTSPAALHRVILGKNLAVWAYNVLLLAIGLGTWAAFVGLPGPRALIVGVLLFASTLLTFTAVGNVISMLFPARRNISSMSNSPSHLGVLLSFVSLGLAATLAGAVVAVPMLVGRPALQPLALALLLALEGLGYALSLRVAARLLDERRERICARV